ncbi:MAG TPA: hypothetical protein VLB44_18780, partial [Kofleriaceae bacterium]|nr:hypothetical protein [Kofleriaceae bacterium]
WSLAQQMLTNGRPIVRPFGLVAPEAGVHPNDEYLLGDSLLVAPVITAGATGRDVALPPGQWLDWWTGEPATTHATADLDTLPLYIVRGAIVPMLRDTIDTLAPTTQNGVESYANDPGTLVVRIAFGPPAQLTLFDEGSIETSLSHIVFTPGKRFTRGALFEVIANAAPASVTADGATLTHRNSYAALLGASEGWFHDPAQTGGTLWIKVPGGADITIQ